MKTSEYQVGDIVFYDYENWRHPSYVHWRDQELVVVSTDRPKIRNVFVTGPNPEEHMVSCSLLTVRALDGREANMASVRVKRAFVEYHEDQPCDEDDDL